MGCSCGGTRSPKWQVVVPDKRRPGGVKVVYENNDRERVEHVATKYLGASVRDVDAVTRKPR